MPKIPQIKCGVFQFQVTDYHAILGVPVGASPEEVRKQYLKITRILFPDIRKIENEEEKQLADQLLSKLVNPSYETLYKNQSERNEHSLVLEEIGNRLVQQGKAPLKSKMARELLKAGDNQEILYHKYLSAIAQKEYQVLNKTLERIALISELNLVYLISQAENNKVVSSAAVANKNSSTSSQESNTETSPETSSETTSTNLIESYLRRGKKLIDNKDYSKAILELREALKLEPKNTNVHTLVGLAYFKQNHLGMAKVHINKALQLDPNNKIALEGKQALEKRSSDANTTDSNRSDENSPQKKSNANSRGIFGGLFGRKKNN